LGAALPLSAAVTLFGLASATVSTLHQEVTIGEIPKLLCCLALVTES